MRRWSALTLALPLAVAQSTCSSDPAPAVAKQIAARNELIGGPGALGEVGDYLLANDQIRVIVQGAGYSRGFGVYGGAIVDADIQRPGAAGSSSGGTGYDNFSEMFPAFFLEAMQPANGGIEVKQLEDGSATITVRGKGAQFLFMLEFINEAVLGDSGLQFENEYKLRPGKRYVEITTSMINVSGSALSMPAPAVDAITMGVPFAVPVGDVILFGAGNKVFAPKAGFDLRFTLEELYKNPLPLPALPGLVTPFLATVNDHVSYGFASGITDPANSFAIRAGYPGAAVDDVVVPFNYSSFTGAFYGAVPPVLEDRQRFSFKKFLMVGRGDVASIRDILHELRGAQTGSFSGRVRNAVNKTPESGASVVTYDASGAPYSQHTPNADGVFSGTYAPGKYTYRVVAEGRFTTEPVGFEVKAGEKTGVEIELPLAGLVNVRIRGEDGRPMPGKCSFVGRYGQGASGRDPKTFLFDLKAGEHRRPTDLIPDVVTDESTREFLEHVAYVGVETTTEPLRPGVYRAVCSRGIEYNTVEQEVTINEGLVTTVDVKLKHELPTPGWASGDYHLHADPSVDSSMPLDERVTTVAAEGVDVAVATDHNFITDYGPVLTRLGLSKYLQSMVGLEMTTLEVGHFNGFPLAYDPGPITKGAFEWSGQQPEKIFTNLRARGRYGAENTIIQVNHPRDSILGYFNAYKFDPELGMATEDKSIYLKATGPEFGPANFDYGFDALELYNGKRFELLRTYRVPAVLPPEPLPTKITIPAAGEIVRGLDGEIGFPGGLDDWFVMLDQGLRYTAMANSDSHDASDEEAGYPRTYAPVSVDVPGRIPELDLVKAIKAQKAMLTNGPLLFVSANGKGMGETASATGGSVKLTVQALAAGWVDLTEVTILVNGQVAQTIRGDRAQLAKLELDVPVTRDSWIIVEARGDKSMWPVVTPLEVPSIQLKDAVGSLAGAFNIELDPFENLRPDRVTVVKPYAFTNPIFVDTDGNGKFDAPNSRPQALRAAPPALLSRRAAREARGQMRLPTLMKMFQTFNCH